MPEKRSYRDAVVRGFFIGIGVAIVLNIIVSTIWENFTDVGFILKVALIMSVICSVIHTKMTNDEAEETFYRNERIQYRNQQIYEEMQELESDFCQGNYVVPQINSSPFKEDLLSKLKELLADCEYQYYDILKYPDKVNNPSTALLNIAIVMEKHTIFWEEKHNEWLCHLKYAFEVDNFFDDSDSIILKENGQINIGFINRTREFPIEKFNEMTDSWLLMENTEEKLKFIIPITALWKYAMTKPLDMERYNKVKKVLTDYIHHWDGQRNGQRIECYDVILAELYVAKDFGNKVLDAKKRELDCWVDYQIRYQQANEKEEPKHLEHMLAALNWMGLYVFEADILRKIVTAGLSLSDELQERLRFIENVGNDLKKVYDIEENAAYLSLDYSTLNWREEDFIKLFQTLVFESKSLKYALTIREWSKNILMENKTGLNIDEAFAIVKAVIRDEYISSVSCKKTEVQLLSEDGTESRKTGLLIVPDKVQVGFGYIGLLLNVIGFGRNINLRIYTIFIPENVPLETQKQQVLSLKKSTNPDVVAFESGLQTSILKGMEEYMNTGYAAATKESQIPEDQLHSASINEQKTEQLF